MSEDHKTQMPEVNADELLPVVQRALEEDSIGDVTYQVESLSGGAEAGSSLYRFHGTARGGEKTLPWALILKINQSPPGDTGDPTGFRYWKREAEAYRSGLLYDLPGGITTPRCYAVEERPGGACRIWLEEVQEATPGEWSLETYAAVAWRLGCFNGEYLAGRPLPGYPWLSQRWLRAYLVFNEPSINLLSQPVENPMVSQLRSGFLATGMLQAWAARGVYLDLVERLPRTFVHQDAFRRNLLNRRTPEGLEQTVALDWSYVGIAGVGEEIAPLKSCNCEKRYKGKVLTGL